MNSLLKNTIHGLGLLVIFLSLIFFNQKKAQKQISSSGTPQYKVTLTTPPTEIIAGKPVELTWNIEAPDTAVASDTTIYFGPISSPSALTTKDSPKAVGYPHQLADYLDGEFALPDTFSAQLKPLEDTIFYRAYAKVGNQHLWSEEAMMTVKE